MVDPEAHQPLPRPLFARAPGEPRTETKRIGDIAQNREMGKQLPFLDAEPDGATMRGEVGPTVEPHLSVQLDPALRPGLEAGEGSKELGLARARSPEKDEGPAVDDEVHVEIELPERTPHTRAQGTRIGSCTPVTTPGCVPCVVAPDPFAHPPFSPGPTRRTRRSQRSARKRRSTETDVTIQTHRFAPA